MIDPGFSADEEQAIEGGRAVELTVGRTPCVVVRKDVFDRMTQSHGGDGLSEEEVHETVERSWEPDLGLDAYQEFKK